MVSLWKNTLKREFLDDIWIRWYLEDGKVLVLWSRIVVVRLVRAALVGGSSTSHCNAVLRQLRCQLRADYSFRRKKRML